MTPQERAALTALSHCSFGMSTARGFVLDVAAKPDSYELSPRQKWNLGRLAWRYRKQLPRAVSDWALELYAGMAPPAKDTSAKAAKAVEALSRPLRFGDIEQAKANRLPRAEEAVTDTDLELCEPYGKCAANILCSRCRRCVGHCLCPPTDLRGCNYSIRQAKAVSNRRINSFIARLKRK